MADKIKKFCKRLISNNTDINTSRQNIEIEKIELYIFRNISYLWI